MWALPGALRRGPVVPRGLWDRLRAPSRARSWTRLRHPDGLRVHRPRARCAKRDLRGRTVRRADRGDRRSTHSGRRLRGRNRTPPARARARRSRVARRGADRCLLCLRRGSSPRTRARADCAPAGGRPFGRHRLRRSLAQGPADPGGPRGRARHRHRRPDHRDDPRSRYAGRRGSARRACGEAVGMSWRDLGAGEVRGDHVGERHTLAGWVARRRDHGGLIFVDLRDETGICQLVVNPERSPEAAKQAHGIRNEFVLQAEGEVVARATDAVNPNLPTGEVELQVDTLCVLATAPPLPFQLGEDVDEVLRLKYRWLDMRSERMQRNLRLRHTVIAAIRRAMDELEFVDVWTPSMTKGTPEGARDFLVPV